MELVIFTLSPIVHFLPITDLVIFPLFPILVPSPITESGVTIVS